MRQGDSSRRTFAVSAARATIVASIAFSAPQALAQACGSAGGTAPPIQYADQGWTAVDRATFYSTSQGSRLIPLAWFKALRRLDVDEPFAADHLQRYGYLCNESSTNADALPIGFAVDTRASPDSVGLTCAACHTGEVEFERNGTTHVLRIDGAPAKTDIQTFVKDLAAAARATLNDAARYDVFARAAISAGYPAANPAAMRPAFKKWVDGFEDFLTRSLPVHPAPAWGPGRLDGFGMIYNRVIAFDLGIPENYQPADAPVRYPFLWNAPRQDHTEWNGGSPNGLRILGLARNVGQVLGVFADFAPREKFLRIDYSANSVDFDGLITLEEKIEKLEPPRWPFEVDEALARRGKPLFDANCGVGCHEKKASPILGLFGAWKTPTANVGTDPRMALNAKREAPDPGLFEGHFLPPPAVFKRFSKPALATDMLGASVIGVILEGAKSERLAASFLEKSGLWTSRDDRSPLLPLSDILSGLKHPSLDLENGKQLFLHKDLESMLYELAPPGPVYEARVLCGIWAAAPYLHNGSVPNLRELLKRPEMRVSKFMVGSRVYDKDAVGYATDRSPFANGMFVADPQNKNGNGNGGHPFGTQLAEDEKLAIIEYMKTLDARSPDC